MADSHLHGACACDRNQYTVIIPNSTAAQAQVFFDNSAANRRSQATPVTAWLRVPLDWYHSTTYAHFPDETHATIKRTFHTPSAGSSTLPPTRRQFCGYCGTHLTAWSEGSDDDEGSKNDRRADYVDVTLGSLLSESLDLLDSLQLYSDSDHDEDEGDGGKEQEVTARAMQRNSVAAHKMLGRGVPYFEDMVEDSRLGRIKRRKGGTTSADGNRSVQWEIVEIGGDDGEPMGDTATATGEQANKRLKTQA